MVKMYLHIGAHKTGTTSFQYLMHQNRGDLLSLDKTLFPESCNYHFSQHRIAFALKNMIDPERGDSPDATIELTKLSAECASAKRKHGIKKIVLSSEELFTISSENIVYLLSKLHEIADEIEVCAVIRRHDNQFLSLYNQRVKMLNNGYCKPISFHLKNLDKFDDEMFYGKHIRNWSYALGDKDNLTVFFYENHKNTAQLLSEHMISRNLSTGERDYINESVSVKYLECVRHLKTLVDDHDVLKRLAEQARRSFPRNPNESLLSYEERSSIVCYFEKDNMLLEKVIGRPIPYGANALGAKDSFPKKTGLNVRDVLSLWVKAEKDRT